MGRVREALRHWRARHSTPTEDFVTFRVETDSGRVTMETNDEIFVSRDGHTYRKQVTSEVVNDQKGLP